MNWMIIIKQCLHEVSIKGHIGKRTDRGIAYCVSIGTEADVPTFTVGKAGDIASAASKARELGVWGALRDPQRGS